jgi:hypothetical protein
LVLVASPAVIAGALGPNGPRENTVRDMLKRFDDGVLVTGRTPSLCSDRALQGNDLELFKRVIHDNPLTLLDELSKAMSTMLVGNRRISVSTLCLYLQKLGITRRRLYTISSTHCEWKRVLFWYKYQEQFTIDMCIFTDESGVAKAIHSSAVSVGFSGVGERQQTALLSKETAHDDPGDEYAWFYRAQSSSRAAVPNRPARNGHQTIQACYSSMRFAFLATVPESAQRGHHGLRVDSLTPGCGYYDYLSRGADSPDIIWHLLRPAHGAPALLGKVLA